MDSLFRQLQNTETLFNAVHNASTVQPDRSHAEPAVGVRRRRAAAWRVGRRRGAGPRLDEARPEVDERLSELARQLLDLRLVLRLHPAARERDEQRVRRDRRDDLAEARGDRGGLRHGRRAEDVRVVARQAAELARLVAELLPRGARRRRLEAVLHRDGVRQLVLAQEELLAPLRNPGSGVSAVR